MATKAPGDLLAAGQDALARHEWQEARRLLEAAVEAGAGPEALEALGGAAFFLDDGRAVLDARERSYAGYRDADRPVDAARVAIALAWDYRIFRAEAAISDGWLARARRLLEGAGATVERGWLLLREASFALPADVDGAVERCTEAEALGRELGDVDLEMTALALGGLARVSRGEIRSGMAQLDEATAAATAGELRDPNAVGLSCCYLIFACERVRDFDRASQWAQRLIDMAEGWHEYTLPAFCRTHYGTVLVLRGEWAAAEVQLAEGVAGLSARPGTAMDALVRFAELRRRQGRTDEAVALLEQAERHPRAILCRGAIDLDRGDAPAAAEAAARYLRLVGEASTERALGLELLVEAEVAAGRAGSAREGAAELRSIADAAGTDALLAAARLAEGRALAAGGARDDARIAFEDALDLLAQARLPYEAGRARVELGLALRALGRADAAAAELERARGEFEALGAAAEQRRAESLASGRARHGSGPLSRRECEVLGLVSEGLTTAQVAERLVLSEHTVHRHVGNILAKLDVSSRAAAVARAAELGLL